MIKLCRITQHCSRRSVLAREPLRMFRDFGYCSPAHVNVDDQIAVTHACSGEPADSGAIMTSTCRLTLRPVRPVWPQRCHRYHQHCSVCSELRRLHGLVGASMTRLDSFGTMRLQASWTATRLGFRGPAWTIIFTLCGIVGVIFRAGISYSLWQRGAYPAITLIVRHCSNPLCTAAQHSYDADMSRHLTTLRQ